MRKHRIGGNRKREVFFDSDQVEFFMDRTLGSVTVYPKIRFLRINKHDRSWWVKETNHMKKQV